MIFSVVTDSCCDFGFLFYVAVVLLFVFGCVLFDFLAFLLFVCFGGVVVVFCGVFFFFLGGGGS